MAFYNLEVGREKVFIESSNANEWQSVVCSKNTGHQRAGRRITDLSLDVLSKKVVDFSQTMLSDIVVTDKARAALVASKLTGFSLRPVSIATKPSGHGSVIPKLWELVVTGNGGPAHKESGIVKLWECSACGLVRYSAFRNGIVVDTSVYDGSDFFSVVEYPKYVLVSERAKSIIEDNGLTNVTFMESTKLTWPEGVIAPT